MKFMGLLPMLANKMGLIWTPNHGQTHLSLCMQDAMGRREALMDKNKSRFSLSEERFKEYAPPAVGQTYFFHLAMRRALLTGEGNRKKLLEKITSAGM